MEPGTKKKILVTGGAGYIGSALVPELLQRGYAVKVFDNLSFGDFGLADVKDKIEIVEGDVKDPPTNLMDGIYGVIHLAGLSTEPTSYTNPRNTDLVNHLGTEYIAKLAKAAHANRFVFASSCSVYFTYDTPLIPPLFKEGDRVNSISPYSLSKRAAEEALIELTDADFRPTILRKGTLYGFAPKMRYDLVFNSFTKDAYKSGRINVHAGGDIYRPILDIKDAVAAYIAGLELPIGHVGGQIFNVSHANCRIGDFATEFKGMIKDIGGKDIDVEIQPVGITRNYQADNTKYMTVFNHREERPIKDAVKEVWDKIAGGHDVDDIRYYTDKWYQAIAQKKATLL